GEYAIRRGERLSSVLERAGGLTPLAFPKGSVFLREDLREREEERLKTLADRMEREIASLDSERIESRQRAESLLAKLRETRPVGRLVFELDSLIERPGDSNFDLLLRDGDQLFIPRQSQEVTVLGEVQYPTSHLYEPGLERAAYIEKSGGLSANADRSRIYIVRANGNVVTQSPSGWFRRGRLTQRVEPGDTVVVPLDTDSISQLALWTSVSQVIYNVGVAAAAVASF
ncbi:MAG: SLBB domain-containing protein, partial [Pseudomonadota bacterium]